MSEDYSVPTVPVPTVGVDQRVALATAVHAAPGVYAVLVGSGMSSAAGVPTGWQVVQNLIRKVAAAEGVPAEELGEAPELWWARQGRPEPRYDTLLEALASTDAARQLLLHAYFDPPPGSEREPIRPTPGHRVLASMCARGRIRLILTTNFDRLIERALEEQAVAPQVIASPSAVSGMTPLVHAEATVVKLHGDYTMLGLRNTPAELASYPPEWENLLARVLDEFGLLVIGWSAEYDKALYQAISQSPSRRYPTFWASFRGNLTEPARWLIAERRAAVINTDGADEFLTDLAQRIQRLDEVAARRARPTQLRTYAFQPESTSLQQGWHAWPLLQLRSVAAFGPAPLDECGIIRPEHRDAMVSALGLASITATLRSLMGLPAADAPREKPQERTASPGMELIQPIPAPERSTDWSVTPWAYQSTEACSYRLGGDAARGISALARVRFPGYGNGNSVVFTIDVALSLANALALADAARILRDGLVLTTSMLPDVLADILPADADISRAEIHFLAPVPSGNVADVTDVFAIDRSNSLVQRLDLSSLGPATRVIGELMGYAARLNGPLGEREATELVVQAIDYVALANGFLDPRPGIGMLRQALGIAIL